MRDRYCSSYTGRAVCVQPRAIYDTGRARQCVRMTIAKWATTGRSRVFNKFHFGPFRALVPCEESSNGTQD